MRHLFTLVSAFLFGAMVHGAEVSSERLSDQQKVTCTALNDPVGPPPQLECETDPADSVLTTGTHPFPAGPVRVSVAHSEPAFSTSFYSLSLARAPPFYL